ncbi:MAG: MFS transporter [Rhodospirillales bacterium]|nr:MFS transporter [Rhodospirillales bacterium]
MPVQGEDAKGLDSTYAWVRLGVSVLVAAAGGVSLWSVVVLLPAVQSGFHVDRAAATAPYTLTMIGAAFGQVAMGRIADRRGIRVPVVAGGVLMAAGYIASAFATSVWQFGLAQGLMVALGGAATFGPIVADVSRWFHRRRGIAVSLAAAGNYIAGTFWPPVIEHLIAAHGWRTTQIVVGIACLAVLVPAGLFLSRPAPAQPPPGPGRAKAAPIALSPGMLQALLTVAGVACCVAMAMPQAHIVAYCGDLGYGDARGADMLALMMGFGILSRIGSGFIADRLGGLAALLGGSVLQLVALLLYLGFSSLPALYVISALFGLFQGGIIPSYAIIVREQFPAAEAGTRFGVIVMATMLGMALGGWMSGVIYDATGSYHAAFANGAGWNLLNLAIALTLISLSRGRRRAVLA